MKIVGVITWLDHPNEVQTEWIGTDNQGHHWVITRQVNVPPAHRFKVELTRGGVGSTTTATLIEAKRAARLLAS